VSHPIVGLTIFDNRLFSAAIINSFPAFLALFKGYRCFLEIC